jgi:hypothetical protein
MSPETKARLEEIAEDYGCFYGGKPWIAGLLEKIGSNELIVSKAPAYLWKDKPEKPSAPLENQRTKRVPPQAKTLTQSWPMH